MTSLPRATCPICGQSVALRTNGALREHRRWVTLCPASGRRLDSLDRAEVVELRREIGMHPRWPA